jgi:hypothetical protein
MYIKLYSNKSFINEFHDLCLETIKKEYTIHQELNNTVISETGEIIPNNPYKRSDKFFELVIKSNYMIK